MCRSPIAAIRIDLGGSFTLIFPANQIGKSPFDDVDRVVRFRIQAAATGADARSWKIDLVLEPREQFIEQPAWNALALGRVDKPEVQDMDEQHFPVLFEIRQ